jgi:hypothetical protein
MLVKLAEQYIGIKDSKEDNKILRDIVWAFEQRIASFDYLKKNIFIQEEIEKFFIFFLEKQDTLNVSFITESILWQIIDLKSKNQNIKVALKGYLNNILTSKNIKNEYRELDNSNIEKLIKHLTVILSSLELVKTPKDNFNKFELAFKKRVELEKNKIKENTDKVIPALNEFYKEYFKKL